MLTIVVLEKEKFMHVFTQITILKGDLSVECPSMSGKKVIENINLEQIFIHIYFINYDK